MMNITYVGYNQFNILSYINCSSGNYWIKRRDTIHNYDNYAQNYMKESAFHCVSFPQE